MTNFLLVLAIILLGLAYVYCRLHRTNVDIPPNAEKRLGPLGQLKFALDNGLPIRTPLG